MGDGLLFVSQSWEKADLFIGEANGGRLLEHYTT